MTLKELEYSNNFCHYQTFLSYAEISESLFFILFKANTDNMGSWRLWHLLPNTEVRIVFLYDGKSLKSTRRTKSKERDLKKNHVTLQYTQRGDKHTILLGMT